ncbi:hypothetical protein QYF36_003628 [Acer negundo]|nr:hypothetical protein QYF36_003628 [Acer negundo]
MMPANVRYGMVFSPIEVNSRIGDRVVNPLFVMEHGEEVKKGLGDGDKAKQKDMMSHAFGTNNNVKTLVADNDRTRPDSSLDGEYGSFLPWSVNNLSVGPNLSSQFLRGISSISEKSNEGVKGCEVDRNGVILGSEGGIRFVNLARKDGSVSKKAKSMQSLERFSSCRGVAFEIKPHTDPFAIANETKDEPRSNSIRRLWPS